MKRPHTKLLIATIVLGVLRLITLIQYMHFNQNMSDSIRTLMEDDKYALVLSADYANLVNYTAMMSFLLLLQLAAAYIIWLFTYNEKNITAIQHMSEKKKNRQILSWQMWRVLIVCTIGGSIILSFFSLNDTLEYMRNDAEYYGEAMYSFGFVQENWDVARELIAIAFSCCLVTLWLIISKYKINQFKTVPSIDSDLVLSTN